jgi:hypothetical protein
MDLGDDVCALGLSLDAAADRGGRDRCGDGRLRHQCGVIGFGLVAPIIARLSGARFTAQLIWSMIVGALLPLLTDATVQLLLASRRSRPLALSPRCSALLLLLLLGSRRLSHRRRSSAAVIPYRDRVAWRRHSRCAARCWHALVGRDLRGNGTSCRARWRQIAVWRWPRSCLDSCGALWASPGSSFNA